MNIFLTINEDWSVNTNKNFIYKLNGNQDYFQQLTKNKVVVYNKNFLLQNPNKNFLKNKICACFSLNEIEGEKNVFNSYRDLFEFLSFYNQENIFVIGDLEFIPTLLPYCKKAYITKVQEKGSEKTFSNLDKNSNWQLLNIKEPIFENNIVYYFCEYVNKNPLKFNYGYEEDYLI